MHFLSRSYNTNAVIEPTLGMGKRRVALMICCVLLCILLVFLHPGSSRVSANGGNNGGAGSWPEYKTSGDCFGRIYIGSRYIGKYDGVPPSVRSGSQVDVSGFSNRQSERRVYYHTVLGELDWYKKITNNFRWSFVVNPPPEWINGRYQVDPKKVKVYGYSKSCTFWNEPSIVSNRR